MVLTPRGIKWGVSPIPSPRRLLRGGDTTIIPPPPACSEYTAFIARTSGLDTVHQTAYHELICGLASDGVWPKLDALYTYATQDQTVANLNLVSTSFTTFPQGAVTWTVDRGYTGVESSTGTYLFTGFDPVGGSGNFQVANAFAGTWSNSSQQSNYMASDFGPLGAGFIIIQPRDNADNMLFFMNCLGPGGVSVPNADGKGWYAANMDSGATMEAYKNGTSVGSIAIAATASWGGPLPFLATGFFPGQIRDGSGRQISGAAMGGSLTGADHANLYSRMRTYMTAVGVP